MKKLVSILLAASILLSLCSFASADCPNTYNDALQAVSEYCGGSLPEILYAEYYSIDDFEGKPLNAFLIQTASLFFAYCPESGALYAADSSVINSYCGALATEEDKCIYLLWTLSAGLRYLVNNGESRTVIAGEKPVSANEMPAPAPQTPANDAPVPSRRRGASVQLPEGISRLETLPDFLTHRELSDEEISALASASLDTLRKRISCPADFIAWIDSLDVVYVSGIMSNPNGQRTFGADFSYDTVNEFGTFGANVGASLAQYILGDDFTDISTVAAFLDEGDGLLVCGNLFSFEGRQYLISFDYFTDYHRNKRAMEECFPAMEISSLENISEFFINHCFSAFPDSTLLQLFCINTNENTVFDPEYKGFIPSDTENVTEFYTGADALPFASVTIPGITVLTELPEFLTQRKLSDAEISALAAANPETVRKEISCPADYIAWIDYLNVTYYCNIYSGDRGQRTFGSEFSFDGINEYGHFGANISASLAQYILGDDFPDISTVAAFLDLEEGLLVCGNLFSYDGREYLISFDYFTDYHRNSMVREECFPAMEISSPDVISEFFTNHLFSAFPNNSLLQLFRITSDTDIEFTLSGDGLQPDNTEYVDVLYTDAASLSARAERLYGHIKPENISLYNISTVLGGPSLTPEEAYALLDMSPEEVQARVKTAADVLMYMLAARVGDCGGDSVVNVNGNFWHHNLTAFEVMRCRLANCGASANLARYLLDGDYDEVGFILQAYPVGNGGGHVYSYILQDGKYYIIDYSWFIFGNYDPQDDFTVPVVDGLEEYAGIAPQIYGPLSLVFAHCSNGQHAPNIFGDEADPTDFSYYIPEAIEYTLIYQAHERDSYILKTMPLNDPRLDWTTFG